MEGSESAMQYSERHGVKSAAVLTVYDDEIADAIARYLASRIEGRVVVEVGGGIGLLALHMAQYAKRVFCIEANPMWSWTFAAVLQTRKPKNVSYLFGSADEFAGLIHGDVALFCTHSDTVGMRTEAGRFAREVIDVYGEIVEPHWNDLRKLTV
jgi:predicted RNA methylase